MSTLGSGTLGSGTLGDPSPSPPVVVSDLTEFRTFPLEIADIVYTMRDFLNTSYTEGVPSSANSILRHLTIARLATGSNILYPSLGTHTATISHYRMISPGQSFKAVSPEGGEFYGRVIQYNSSTGFFRFKVENITTFLPSNNWSFDFRSVVDIPSSGAINTIANKMTSQATQDLILEAFDLHNIKAPWVYFEDFRGPVALGEGLETVGSASFDFALGDAAVSVYSPSEVSSLYYGNKGFFTISSVGRAFFEARVKHPEGVSSGASSYYTYVGLRGEGSIESAPFSLAGMGFYCNDAVNSGNWVCVCTNAGDTYSANTSVTPVANTYTTFKIVVLAGEAKFYINGTLVATATTVPVDSAGNLMRPLIGLRSTAALSSSRTLRADYMYLEVFGA